MSAVLLDYDSETISLRDDFRRVRHVNRAPRVETYDYIVAPLRSAASNLPSVLPLFSFIAEGRSMQLVQPLMLRVAIDEGAYFVENDTLRLFARGPSLNDAVQSFAHDLAYYWSYYDALDDDEVAGAGVELKRIYANLVSA